MFKRLLSFLLFFNLLTFSIPQLAARSQDQFLSDSIRSIKMFYIPSTLGKRLSETEKYYSRTGLLEKEVFYTIGDFPEETWNNSERVIASTVHHTYNEAGQCIEDIFYENNIETSRIVYGFDENGWLSHELNYYNGKMTYQILYLRDEKGRLKESYRLIESQLAGIHKLASLKKFQNNFEEKETVHYVFNLDGVLNSSVLIREDGMYSDIMVIISKQYNSEERVIMETYDSPYERAEYTTRYNYRAGMLVRKQRVYATHAQTETTTYDGYGIRTMIVSNNVDGREYEEKKETYTYDERGNLQRIIVSKEGNELFRYEFEYEFYQD